MQKVAETSLFIKQAAEVFTEDERKELIDFLAANPQVGDEIRERAAFERFGSAPKARARASGVERGSSTIGTVTTHRSMRSWPMERTRRSI
ncbi:MAG: hypothetical protein ABIQ51_05925 [Mesorhizobium sp.]